VKDVVFEKKIQKTFNIYETDLEYLENINENTSQALRTLIERDRGKTQKQQKIQTINNTLVILCFGLIFIFFSFLSVNIFIEMVSGGMGIALLVYCFYMLSEKRRML